LWASASKEEKAKPHTVHHDAAPEIHSKSTESQKNKRKLKKSQKVRGVKNRKKLAFVQSTLLLQVEWDPIL
jgi:hypothetical protein